MNNEGSETDTEITYKRRQVKGLGGHEHNHAICGFPAGMSPSQQKTLLKKHPSWYRSTVEYDENGFLKTDCKATLTTGSHQNL